MDRLDKVCKERELKVNVEKTKVVIFNRPRRYQVPMFNMQSFTIELDTQYKYLGIILSANGVHKPILDQLLQLWQTKQVKPFSP